MDVEAQRVENIKYKAKLLSDLNFQSDPPSKRHTIINRTSKKRKLASDNTPTRTSARIASSTSRPSYLEPPNEKFLPITEKKPTKQARKERKSETDGKQLVPDLNAEDIRRGWSDWKSIAPPASRDENGVFHFDDFPDFTPNKSPEEVLREGCFGGSYFRPLKSRRLGIMVEDDWKELPHKWHSGLDVNTFLVSPTYDSDINKFKVACGQSIEEWEANGWIAFEHDIRGWFQWYCRFFRGRRCTDDVRQVSRWRKCVGGTGRWRRMLLKKYLQSGVREVFDDGEDDKEVSPVMHQTCHHWAYQVHQLDLDEAWRGYAK